jgi:cold shock CspA family protein
MQLPIQIAFHNMPHNADIESAIRANADWLENYYSPIMSCRVVVDRPHMHHKKRNQHQIRIVVKSTGIDLAAKRGSSECPDYEDLDIMIRDAFDDLRRQLEDEARRQRGEVKTHAAVLHARVLKLFPESGYGFLQTPEGREVYFHKHSVVDAKFDDLQAGTEVRFVEELGDKGPQATTVTLVGRHGHA